MRHRLDGNHQALCKVAEKAGWLVEDVSQTGLGYDLLLTRGGRTVRAEVKDGMKPISAQQLTPHEKKVHAKLKAHGVTVEILTCAEDVLMLSREQPGRAIG